MSLTLDDNQAIYQIRGYQPGSIQINEQIFHQSVIVTTSQLFTDWTPQDFIELTRQHLARVIDLKPDILLIGTGSVLQFPPESLYGNLINKGIGVEIMNTHAACRTFNALSAENRNIAAALIIK